jgi:hypothetical protein
MGTPAITPNPPAKLPANFDQWDKSSAPPTKLPSNFTQWDAGTTPANAPSTLQSIGNTALDLVKGVGKGALHTLDSTDDWARAHLPAFMTNTKMGFGPPADLAAEHAREQPNNTAQKIGFGGEQVGEFLLPTGIEEGAARLGTAALGKGAGIATRAIGAGVHSGLVNKAQGGNFGTGAATGVLGSGIGQGLKAIAPAMAETALRVRGNDRLYGRTVGDAILNDTTGVRPSTIADSAQGTISRLTPQLESKAAQASQQGATGSLLPARLSTAHTMATHMNNYAPLSAQELEPLEDRLATNPRTGHPFAPDQSPSELLRIKRGLNSDFIQNWKPDQPPGLRSSAKTAYGSLADEFHSAAPGTKELDQRISSLIPVTKRAEAVGNGAGLIQRTAGRISAHTGVLGAGALTGGAAGYHEGGLPGAVIGTGLGVMAPEMLSSPTAQMIMARGLYGGVPKIAIPAAVGAGLQLDRRDNK